MLDVFAWHDASVSAHLSKVDHYAALGYRTMTLSLYGQKTDPRFAAVMVKRPIVIAEEQHPQVPLAGLPALCKTMQAKGLGLAILTAVGPKDSAVCAASFMPAAQQPLVEVGLSAAAFAKANADAAKQGRILVWADTYGAPGDLVYLGVWQANTDRRAWNVDGIDDDDPAATARFHALVGGFARPTLIARTGGAQGGTLVLYDDSFLPNWTCFTDMTSDQYQAKFDEMGGKGLRPVRVSAKGDGPAARFAAIFAAQEYTAAREHRSSDLVPFGIEAVEAIDDAMVAVLDATMLHGASVAIVKGTRLVYARGYTFAEPGYPDVRPTTLFRQASVSKIFTAAAIYELIDEKIKLPNGSPFSTDTLVLDVLPELVGVPSNAAWKTITIRHLLEMTSGVTTSILGTDPAATDDLPADSLTIARWLYRQPLANTPGDPKAAEYSNAGFMILGLVVAKLRHANGFVEALQGSLMKHLHITRLRAASSVATAQAPDEARYHARPLTTRNSVMAKGQPICTTGYGEWNLAMTGGGGGLSAAATDVARLLAAFSVTGFNPLMSTGTLGLWMKNAAEASATFDGPKPWGFHGLDAVSLTDAAKGTYSGYKGGDLSSSQNGIYFEMGGYSTVLCFDGLTPQPCPKWYPAYDALLTAARNHPWGDVDLFPKFGMPSFSQALPPVVLPKPPLRTGLPTHRFNAEMSKRDRPDGPADSSAVM